MFALAFLAIGIGIAGETAARPGAVRTWQGSAGGMTTPEHIRSSAWWPTKPVAKQDKYVGSAACAKCHEEIVHTQAKSQMARTLSAAGNSSVLHQHMSAQYHSGTYTYAIQAAKGGALAVAVSDQSATLQAPLQWAFGSGEVGQSYMWQQDGSFNESRFNYFSSLGGFAATPGRLHGSPISLDTALGRRVEGFEARTCFACHTTTMSAAMPLDTKTVVPGVGCEACHGPGADHVAAMQTGSATPSSHAETHIVNGKRMSPANAVDMCGSCHSTPWDVRIMGAVGVQTVRFPAYRLEKSRCWGVSGDARVTCTACHDPHEPLAREPVAYDGACLDCHVKKGETHAVNEQRPGAACPVGTSKCVTCHMPKYDIPEMHYKFTDHMIRVARNGAPFPD